MVYEKSDDDLMKKMFKGIYFCPDCGTKLHPDGGCSYCPFCGYSKCS
jgi:rubrerythrin